MSYGWDGRQAPAEVLRVAEERGVHPTVLTLEEGRVKLRWSRSYYCVGCDVFGSSDELTPVCWMCHTAEKTEHRSMFWIKSPSGNVSEWTRKREDEPDIGCLRS